MTRMTGGAAVVEALRREGVTHVFGVIGTALLEVYDALYDCPDIRYIGARHEQNGVHMADGYARVSGGAGVMLAGQPGPGATNLVTGIAEAQLAFSPVVAIGGSPMSYHMDKGTFQEVDQQALFTPITKRTWTVHAANRIPEYLRDAFRISLSGRRGPVMVNIPQDHLAEEVDVEFQPPDAYRASEGVAPAPSSVERAAKTLNGAKRPLIIAGAGVKWAGASRRLLELAELINAPIAASGGNGDVVPNDHPLYTGQVGPRGNAVATGLAKTADVILALGTRLGLNTTLFSHDNISADAEIIQVDIEPAAIGRYFPVAVGVVADAGLMVDALLPLVHADADRAGWVAKAQQGRRELLEDRARAARESSPPLHPNAIFAAIQRDLPRNTIFTIDTGTCSLFATDSLQTYQPPGLIAPLDFGLVGFSYAAGLGAKVAAPDRPVISIVGDGGFTLTMGEIGTALDAGLNTIAIVMNNSCWGAEKAYQRDFFGGRYIGADITNPAFDAIARAYGANGVRADSADDLTAAVQEALHADKPTVIEVAVDQASISSFRRDSFTYRASPEQTSNGA